MPFIRFALGDLAVQGERRCRCGAPFSTIREIRGRVMDMFRLPDGRLVHPYTVASDAVDLCDWIRRWQLVQERLDRVVLRLEPSGAPVDGDVRRIVREARERLGPGVALEVEMVDALRPGPSGKFHHARSLVSGAESGGVADGGG